MPPIYEHHHRVRTEEIDGLGHVNNVVYFNWMIAAALAHSRAQGWPDEAYLERGAGWVVRAHQITYVKPAMPDDTILVRTWVARHGRVTSLRRYRILRGSDGALLARAATEWAFVDFGTLRPLRIPEEVMGSFDVLGDEPPDVERLG